MSKITINLPAPNSTGKSNFYLWGMTAAGTGGTISIIDPNNNTWNYTYPGGTEGVAFNLPNPGTAGSSPFGFTEKDLAILTFTITITSNATTGSNEGINYVQSQIPSAGGDFASVATVIYNDPSDADSDYNDVILNFSVNAKPS